MRFLRNQLNRPGLYFKGGDGGDGEIKETEDQRALAQIAGERWKRYQDVFVPVENEYMADVTNANNPGQMQHATEQAQAATRSEFSKAIATDVGAVTNAGINPNSGTFNAAVGDGNRRMAVSEADVVNKTQQALDDRKIQGMQNVISMGSGQATQAIAGLNDVATGSAETASNKAVQNHNDSSANKYLASQVAGAGTRTAMGF